MSRFEFISVAQSVLCSLIVVRALGLLAVPGLTNRYSVHTAWVVFCLISATVHWWIFWSYVDVSWTYSRFVLALTPTGLVYAMTATMVPADPAGVVSWRDYYYKNKNRFFAYAVGFTLAIAASAYWMLGVPILHPRGMAIVVLLAMSGTGLASNSHRVHVLNAAAWALLVFTGAAGLWELNLTVPSE